MCVARALRHARKDSTHHEASNTIIEFYFDKCEVGDDGAHTVQTVVPLRYDRTFHFKEDRKSICAASVEPDVFSSVKMVLRQMLHTFCVSGQIQHSFCLSVTPSHQLASSVGRPQQAMSKRV